MNHLYKALKRISFLVFCFGRGFPQSRLVYWKSWSKRSFFYQWKLHCLGRSGICIHLSNWFCVALQFSDKEYTVSITVFWRNDIVLTVPLLVSVYSIVIEHSVLLFLSRTDTELFRKSRKIILNESIGFIHLICYFQNITA